MKKLLKIIFILCLVSNYINGKWITKNVFYYNSTNGYVRIVISRKMFNNSDSYEVAPKSFVQVDYHSPNPTKEIAIKPYGNHWDQIEYQPFNKNWRYYRKSDGYDGSDKSKAHIIDPDDKYFLIIDDKGKFEGKNSLRIVNSNIHKGYKVFIYNSTKGKVKLEISRDKYHNSNTYKLPPQAFTNIYEIKPESFQELSYRKPDPTNEIAIRPIGEYWNQNKFQKFYKNWRYFDKKNGYDGNDKNKANVISPERNSILIINDQGNFEGQASLNIISKSAMFNEIKKGIINYLKSIKKDRTPIKIEIFKKQINELIDKNYDIDRQRSTSEEKIFEEEEIIPIIVNN